MAAEFLRNQHALVIGAADDDGRVWAGMLAGPIGFAAPRDDRTIDLSVLPHPGDPLHGLFEQNRDVGLLAIEPQTRRRMRVNGIAVRADEILTVSAEQVYSNCPKHIQARPYTSPPVPRQELGRNTALSQRHCEWITEADTFFIATYVMGYGADASHRGGNPGFVSVTGPRTLQFEDYPGNSMFMTLGNLELDPAAGLLFVDWERGETLQLTGRAWVEWNDKRIVHFELDEYIHPAGTVSANADANAPLPTTSDSPPRIDRD
ncbi:pyridoxamine 5'-phosphate oxidase family protein [Rhodococcus sp. JVH1]|uniref:pyridoxamine 5'-phosphate oxidase family protein n=1 Tax=Rhodococcus sp. JVH1 TaxID=745408 RepID=UPI00027212AD|nr:pyridoxamine 5'-phosphate oxidase family protein [Rhodococcus sp. JVH1]EJI98389.1 pyridoxamine 5'-phosphate oxidase family protein [Rhodococcus sp. JVH1]